MVRVNLGGSRAGAIDVPRAERPTFRTASLATLLVAVLLVVTLVPAPGGASDTGTTHLMDAKMPTGRDGVASATHGAYVYLFGGDTGTRSQEILRYAPATDTLVVLPATLPQPLSGASAVSNGTHIFLFGGWGGPYRDSILRFDPATETIQTMAAKLPSGRTYTSAIFDGTYAYIFGGSIACSPCTTDDILRYDPATDTIQTLATKLPTRRTGTSAVYDGRYAYIFGGNTVSPTFAHDTILRYDPVGDHVVSLAAKLPTPRYHTSAVWGDGKAHIYGGFDCTGSPCDTIVDFDPDTGTVTTNATRLSLPLYLTTAARFDRDAYIFGGYDGQRSRLILAHDGVIPNQVPQVTGPTNLALQATETLQATYTVSDGDDPGTPLMHTALPTGATWTDHANGTYTLAWTPGKGQAGTYPITLSADDGRDRTDHEVVIHVGLPPDHAPVLGPAPDRLLYAFDEARFDLQATDADGDPITLTLGPLPTNATFTDHGNGTGTFVWRPRGSDTGTYPLTFNATANGTSDTTDFQLDVTLPPDGAPVVSTIDDATLVAGEPFSLDLEATDPDGDPISFSVQPLPSGATLVDHGNGTATFSWTPARAQEGTHLLRFDATANGTATSQNVTFEVVLPPDRPPVVDPIPDLEASVDERLLLGVRATDPDEGVLTLTLVIDPAPSTATFTDHGDGTGTLDWIPAPGQVGLHNLTLSAYDGNHTTNETFTVLVVDGPPPQVLAIDDAVVSEGSTFTQVIAATDPDGRPLTLSVTPLPSGATFSDNGGGSGTFSWNIPYDAAGVHTFTATADNGERHDTETFTLTVLDVDRPPAFHGASSVIRTAEHTPLTVTYNVSDPDGTPVTFTMGPAPAGITFTDAGNGTATLSWPDPAPLGTRDVVIHATSGNVTATHTQRIEVARPYDVALDSGPFRLRASPGDVLNVSALVTNTGAYVDNYTFTTRDLTGYFGLEVIAPEPIRLEPGATANVHFTVVVQEGASYGRPLLQVHSEGDPERTALRIWIVAVPVQFHLDLNDETPNVLEGTSLVGLNGTVNLTWLNGEPVTNQTFQVAHALFDLPIDAFEATTDENGSWAFDGLARPTFGLPGNHILDVGLARPGIQDTGRFNWSIGLGSPRELQQR